MNNCVEADSGVLYAKNHMLVLSFLVSYCYSTALDLHLLLRVLNINKPGFPPGFEVVEDRLGGLVQGPLARHEEDAHDWASNAKYYH